MIALLFLAIQVSGAGHRLLASQITQAESEQPHPTVNELGLPVEWVLRNNDLTLLGKTPKGKLFQSKHAGIKHIERFIALLRHDKPELPFVQIIVLSKNEFRDVTAQHACVTCPQLDEVRKKRLWGRLLSRSVRIYISELADPDRTLELEMYLTHAAFYFSEVALHRPATETARYELWQSVEPVAQARFDRILHHAELVAINWPSPNDLKPRPRAKPVERR